MKNPLVSTILIVLISLCSIQFLNTQNESNTQVTPMAPESASLGKHGNLALSGATGHMSFSVPIYNIEVDGNSWPISLSYSYNGLILEEKPSLSGLGWHLSAYGNITKQTRGMPDGHPQGGYYGNSSIKDIVEDVVSQHYNGGFTTSFDDLRKFRDGTWDSEVDLYTVNIAGERFSFKIILVNNVPEPYYLSKTNYKVQINKNTTAFKMDSFVVTDNNGINYFFNDYESITYDPYEFYAQDDRTSWLLSEIKYTNGQSITFNYGPGEYHRLYDFYASGSEQDLDTSDVGQTPDVPYQNWAIGYSEGVRTTDIDRKILKSITFPQGSLQFTTPQTSRKLFTKIQLKDYTNSLVNTYDLFYGGSRDLLTQVLKNNEKYYAFKYYGHDTSGNIPDFFLDQFSYPRDQDYWRYFNNAGNTRAIHLPFDDKLANKLPNFTATRLGALKTITYPTGGFTEVEYEQNQEKKPYSESQGAYSGNQPFNDSFVVRVDAKTDNNDRYETITKTFDYPVRAVLYHKIKGSVIHGNSIYMDISSEHGALNQTAGYSNCYSTNPVSSNYYPTNIQSARSYLIEDTEICPFYPYPIIAPFLSIAHDPDNHCVWWNNASGESTNENMGCVSQTEVDAQDSSRGEFFLPPGTYTFTVDVRNLAYDGVMGEIGLRWYDPAIDNEGILPEFVNVNVGGIRVSKIIDYTKKDVPSNIKVYDYNGDDGFSTARLNQVPYFKNEHRWHHIQDGNSTNQKFDEYLLNSYTALNTNHGTPVFYEQIKMFNTNNVFANASSQKPQGYSVTNFNLPLEDLNDTYPRVPIKEDITKAIPSEIKQISTSNTTVSIKSFDYAQFRHDTAIINQESTQIDNNPEHPWSFKYYKKLENTVDWDNYNYTPNSEDLKMLHELKPYKELQLIRLRSSETSTIQGVTKTISYSHDNHLMLQNTTTQDSKGDVFKVEYDYPYESTESVHLQMTNGNQISTPYEERSYKNGDLISRKKSKFLFLNNGYRPSEILTAKDDAPLTRELSFSYNINGTIKEIQKNNNFSPPTSFIWGYNYTKPVAKIENGFFATANNTIGGSNTIQNLEGASLRNALDALRSGMPESQVTTYTYNSLIGVSSITNPNNQTQFYEYDTSNRLKYIKDKDQNVLEQYSYTYRVEELEGFLFASSSSIVYGNPVFFNMSTTGGSGNFSYEWHLMNDNLDLVTSSTSESHTINTTLDHSPNFTLQCTITDITTGQTFTDQKQITVYDSYPALNVSGINVSPSGTTNLSVGDVKDYSVNITGGSGSYMISWVKTNPDGDTILGGNTLSLSSEITTDDCPGFSIKCTVTDAIANMSKTKIISLIVNQNCSNGNQN